MKIDLQGALRVLTACGYECDDIDELAAQIEAMRAGMQRARNILTNGKPTPASNWGMLAIDHLPNIAEEILRKRDVKLLRAVIDLMPFGALDGCSVIRKMIEELEAEK